MITLELDDRTLHIEPQVLEQVIEQGAGQALASRGLDGGGMVKMVIDWLVGELSQAMLQAGHAVPPLGRGERSASYLPRLIARAAVIQLDGDYAATIERRNGSDFLVAVSPAVASDDSD